MKNYIQPGHAITLAAPYDVVSGAGLLVGSIFGVASHDALSGAEVETQLTGVIDLAKVASQAWTAGAKVYWDNTAKRVTNVASGNTLVGVAVLAVGAGADESSGGCGSTAPCLKSPRLPCDTGAAVRHLKYAEQRRRTDRNGAGLMGRSEV